MLYIIQCNSKSLSYYISYTHNKENEKRLNTCTRAHSNKTAFLMLNKTFLLKFNLRTLNIMQEIQTTTK